MSLRARLALSLGLLAAVAVVAVASFAYLATGQRLHSEIDQSLQQGADRLAHLGMAMGPGMVAPFGALGGGSSGPGSLFGLVVVQYLDQSGSVRSTLGQLALPVDGRDQVLARSGGAPWWHSVTVDGTSYRVLTEALAGGGAVQVARDDTETDRVLASLRWRFGLVGLAVVAVAAAAGWALADRISRPLRRLARAAEHVTASGKLDVAIPGSGHGETARLAGAFSTMLGALARSRERQQQLAQDAGHELRTPLTSLRSNVDILRRHADLPAERRQAILAALDSELRELTGLVDELVELAGDHHDEPPAGPVALDRLARQVVERARQRGGRTITITTEPCIVVGRSEELARALSNILDNAVKFSPDESTIEVTVRAGRVEVRDHGPGIAAEDLPRVFDRFYRSDAARSQPGSGLGLAIVRHVAESHGGRAFVANHPDGGALIGIELPTETHAPAGSAWTDSEAPRA